LIYLNNKLYILHHMNLTIKIIKKYLFTSFSDLIISLVHLILIH